jgi:hypothetical protein
MKKQKGTTDFLEYAGETIFDGNLLNVKIVDIFNAGYKEILYGYVEDFNDNWDLWTNCDEKCCVKVGELHTYSKYDKNVCSETYKNMSVSEAVNYRVQQQRTGSSYNVLTPVFCFLAKPNSEAGKKDDEFRNFCVDNCGCVHGKGENIYGITFDNIKGMYAKYKGCERTLKNFPLTEEQEACVDLMLKYYNTESGKYENIPALPVLFLLAAKCRFGKNFTILKFIEMVGFKNILFLSYKPSVFSSLADEINGHEDFKDGWCYKNNRVEKDISPYDDNGKITTVVSTSVQQLIHDMNTDTCDNVYDVDLVIDVVKKHLKKLANSNMLKAFVNKVDLLVLDEAHFGGYTNYWNEIINIIKPKMVIYVTGTASNFLKDHRFKDNVNVYKYDYVDERIYHPEMPKIEIYTYEMPDIIKKLKDQYDSDEMPTMTKLLSNITTCKDIVLTILGKGKIESRNDINFNNMTPYRNPYFEPYIMHTFWTCPNVECAKNVVKVLNEFDEFKVFDCSGNDGYRDIDVVKKQINIAKYQNKKTITVTVERFREGVNVPTWGAVFLLDDCESYNKNIQTWFRGQTPFDNFWNGMSKDKCFVFDFNPERCLSIRDKQIYEYQNTKFKSSAEWTKILFDTMPLMYCDHCGKLKNNDEVLEIMNEISRKRFEGANYNNLLNQVSSINYENLLDLSNDAITEILNRKDRFKNGNNNSSNSTETHTTNTNGVPGGKNGKRIQVIIPDSDNNTNIPDSKRTSVIETLDNILKRLPRFLIQFDGKYECLKNVIDDIEHNSDSSILFEDITKVEASFFVDVVYNNNIIKEQKFKYFIEEFNRQFADAKISSEWEEFESRWIYLDGEEKDIPFDIVEEIYNF